MITNGLHLYFFQKKGFYVKYNIHSFAFHLAGVSSFGMFSTVLVSKTIGDKCEWNITKGRMAYKELGQELLSVPEIH